MPDWVHHVVWWQIHPLGFVDAPLTAQPEVVHRLPRVEAWLDYLIELGASGLALGPIFTSASHGYDTIDYYRIDPRLGDEADFAHLVEQAHARGIRVLLDGVFNHVGRDFPMFQEGRADWFHLYPGGEYEHFEGHRDLVTLNHGSPVVVDFVVDVMCHWLERGADGWRLDAAYAIPAGFWAQVLPRVRERFPQAYIVGEMIHGDYVAYVQEAGLDSVTEYELWKAIWSSLNDRNFHELTWTLGRHNGFLEHYVPLTFLGNHDVTRIASKLTDEQHYPHALAILMTVGGTPSIYAGDEQGFRGIKEDRPGGDDEVRQAFPEHPADLAPFGEGWFRMHQELIGLRRRHPWLERARTDVYHVTDDQIAYRSHGEGGALLVGLNVGDGGAVLPVGGPVIAGQGQPVEGGMLVPEHGWVICED
ncbi:MAG TPA: alpha-amylase family glycosyl hydrolase [Actinomycetota bacterium]|nr:alpha-amylase family glycosyl hydrolase [Actinomycetota bacterium]HNO14986.1 alpha-amylase family glycosyl hydrolase [Actinomycetota bacterium]HUM87583.1 alpha-amylase family glycosyl hydrolase [Actinomycetota bacterium]